MKHATLIARFMSTAWALQPEQLAVLASVVQRWALGGAAATADLAAVEESAAAFEARRTSAAQVQGGTAVIPVYGVITQRAAMFSEVSGMCSAETVSAQLRSALADDSVASILLDIDSPGGAVAGVQELADEIFAARGKKPITALANSLAASAAYWIGSQASDFRVIPSGQVGSIGVYGAHEDYSKAMEAAGVKVTLVSAGKFKTEGAPYEPLGADARAHMQEMVDAYYASFTRAVARGRGVAVGAVREGMGEGRCLVAGAAKDCGMVDAVSTYAETLRAMARRPSRNAANARALAMLA